MSAQRSALPEAVLCTTTVDGHASLTELDVHDVVPGTKVEIRRRPREIA